MRSVKEFSQDEIREIIFDKLRNRSYIEEEQADNILNGIKQVCFSYLYNDEISLIEDSDIQNALNFLAEKMNHYNKLKESLKIRHYSWSMTEFAQSLDEYILSGDRHGSVHENIDGKLAKDLSSTLELLSFCYGVMIQIQNFMDKHRKI